jgi:hypothetical protein
MKIWLGAGSLIFLISILHSGTALGSSSVTLASASQGTLIAEGSASGTNADAGSATLVEAGVADATILVGTDFDSESAGMITEPEVTTGGADDAATITLSLASAAPSPVTTAFKVETAAIPTSLALENSASAAVVADSIATPETVIPESPTIPEPSAWQGLIFGGVVLIAASRRAVRKVA